MNPEEKTGKVNIGSIPLLILVPLSALLFSVFVLIDPAGQYRAYENDPAASPYFVRMMEGIRDGQWPLAGNLSGNGEFAVEGTGGTEGDLENVLGAGDPSVLPDGAKAEEDVLIGKDGTLEGPGKNADVGTGKGSGSVSADTVTTGENGDGKTDTSETKEESQGAEGELDLTIPEESTCPVCQATDYGIAAQRFLSPSDWEAEVGTSGMFAPNGYYRPLEKVEKEYFSDALFIGDSRVDGLCDYGKIADQATFLSLDSVTIKKLYTESLHYHDAHGGRGRRTLFDALSMMNYRKIYIEIGVNEIGTGNTATFYKDFKELVMTIRSKQPLAVIYIQGIMHVTAGASSSSPVFTNTNIVEKNEAIATLANGRDIFYLDFNPAVCDENGNLRGDLSRDSAHLKATAYEKWTEFLMEHAVDPEASAVPRYKQQ